MLFYFDESGDFAFPDDRFDVYTQAVVICADSKLPAVEEYVEGRKDAWSVDELHGVNLDDDRLQEICRFIRDEQLPLLAQATDTNALSRKAIERHRLDQAVRFRENYDTWRLAGGASAEVDAWYEARVKRAAYPTRPSNGEWVQSDLLIELIHQALNKAIATHLDDRWRDDFRDFRFIFDGKLPSKLAAGEKQLQSILLPALGSNRGRYDLIGVIEWRNPPVHPWEEKYSTVDGKIDLRVLFEHGLEFKPSAENAGLQLADVVAYTTRRRILSPKNQSIRLAWNAIRPLLLHSNRQPLRICTYRIEGQQFAPPDDSRYADL